MAATRENPIVKFLLEDEKARGQIISAVNSNLLGGLNRMIEMFPVTTYANRSFQNNNERNLYVVNNVIKNIREQNFFSSTLETIKQILNDLLTTDGMLRDEILEAMVEIVNQEEEKKGSGKKYTVEDLKEKFYGLPPSPEKILKMADRMTESASLATSGTFTDALRELNDEELNAKYTYLYTGREDDYVTPAKDISYYRIHEILSYTFMKNPEAGYKRGLDKFNSVVRRMPQYEKNSDVKTNSDKLASDLASIQYQVKVESTFNVSDKHFFALEKLNRLTTGMLDVHKRELDNEASSGKVSDYDSYQKKVYLTRQLQCHFSKQPYREKLIIKAMKMQFDFYLQLLSSIDDSKDKIITQTDAATLNNHLKKLKETQFNVADFNDYIGVINSTFPIKFNRILTDYLNKNGSQAAQQFLDRFAKLGSNFITAVDRQVKDSAKIGFDQFEKAMQDLQNEIFNLRKTGLQLN